MAVEFQIQIEDDSGLEFDLGSSNALEFGTRDVIEVRQSGDYPDLTNKPSINGVTLVGNKTTEDLGIEAGVTSWNGQTGDVNYTPPEVPVQSVNGQTGAVVLDAEDVGALPDDTVIPSKTSDLTNDNNFINASQAPVQSVNGRTGAVVVNEALEPLVGDTDELSPADVRAALIEGRSVKILNVSWFEDVQLALIFTNFNIATDVPLQGAMLNVVISQTIVRMGTTCYLWTLLGDVVRGAWESQPAVIALRSEIPSDLSDLNNDMGFINSAQAASAAPVQSVNGQTGDVSLTIPTVPTTVSSFTNDAGYVNASGAASAAPVQSVNGQTGDVSLSIPTVPTNVSSFTNDAGYLTLADLPIYNGGVQ